MHVLRHKDSVIFTMMPRKSVIVLGGSEIVTGSSSPGKEAERAGEGLSKWTQAVEWTGALGLRVGGDMQTHLICTQDLLHDSFCLYSKYNTIHHGACQICFWT